MHVPNPSRNPLPNPKPDPNANPNAFSYRTVCNSNRNLLTLRLNMVIEFGTAIYRIANLCMYVSVQLLIG